MLVLLLVEHQRGLDHDVEEGGQDGVVLGGLVEVLVPGGQREAALVQLEDVTAGVLVVLPDIPDKEPAHVVSVLQPLGDGLEAPGLQLSSPVEVRDVPVEMVQEPQQRLPAQLLQGAVGVETGGVVGPGLQTGRALRVLLGQIPLQNIPERKSIRISHRHQISFRLNFQNFKAYHRRSEDNF